MRNPYRESAHVPTIEPEPDLERSMWYKSSEVRFWVYAALILCMAFELGAIQFFHLYAP